MWGRELAETDGVELENTNKLLKDRFDGIKT